MAEVGHELLVSKDENRKIVEQMNLEAQKKVNEVKERMLLE
jgi:hypothetical protein